MRRDVEIQGQKKNEVGEGEEVCTCVRTHLSITQSWDSLLTSQTRGSFQNHRLGPAGNWWSALCHGKRISTHSNTQDVFLVPLNTSVAYLGDLQWLAKAFRSLTPKPKLICSPSTLQLEEIVSAVRKLKPFFILGVPKLHSTSTSGILYVKTQSNRKTQSPVTQITS